MAKKSFPPHLTAQLITYLGNKRSLLPFLARGFELVRAELGGGRLRFADLFSGSGVVARFARAHSDLLIANDLEPYARIINHCYLTTPSPELLAQLSHLREEILTRVRAGLAVEFGPNSRGQAATGRGSGAGSGGAKPGGNFIRELYSPRDEDEILPGERAFFTPRNALFLDLARQGIEECVPPELRHFFIAPLLYEASVHANTSGVFKGFYKGRDGRGRWGGAGGHALGRIKGEISLPLPVFAPPLAHSCEVRIFEKDAQALAHELKKECSKSPLDLVYLDPPYNQHPYGSNYFLLNLIAQYERPTELSRVSGIPPGWNRSVYNRPSQAEAALLALIDTLPAKFILLSYNCEGFVKKESFLKSLAKLGQVRLLEQSYPAFRASRNLAKRPRHVSEQLYILKKR